VVPGDEVTVWLATEDTLLLEGHAAGTYALASPPVAVPTIGAGAAAIGVTGFDGVADDESPEVFAATTAPV
jgi:hypothetical protein